MIYPSQKIAELVAENKRLREAGLRLCAELRVARAALMWIIENTDGEKAPLIVGRAKAGLTAYDAARSDGEKEGG